MDNSNNSAYVDSMNTSSNEVNNHRLKQELSAIYTVLNNRKKPITMLELLQNIGKIAFSDEITGLPNRTYLNYYLLEILNKCKKNQMPLSLIMMEIDDFKSINESYGHPGGDSIICQVSSIMGGQVRSVQSLMKEKDLYARFGGVDFVIVLPGVQSQAAKRVIERIKSGIRNHAFEIKGSPISRNITASFGLTEFNVDEDNPDSILEKAGSALIEAKMFGKNSVAVKGV